MKGKVEEKVKAKIKKSQLTKEIVAVVEEKIKIKEV